MKKLICIIFVLTIILLNKNNNKENIIIPDKSIRFRIIANSNSEYDQELKFKIKKDIQEKVFSTLKTNNYDNAEDSIKMNKKLLDEVLKKYNINYNISYGENYFPEKVYKGVIYPEGEYQSLVVTLGEGIGDNWWCVLFPPLCLLEANENEYTDVEYSLYTKEIINKFMN